MKHDVRGRYKQMTQFELRIETARLMLRRFRTGDADAIYQYRSHPSVTQFQPWHPKNVAEVEAFLERQLSIEPEAPDTSLRLAITLKKAGSIVGDCSIRFFSDEPRQVELGFNLSPSCRKRGYATEALTGVLEYVFETLHKHRAFARTDPENKSAIALLERLGMRKEGHFLRSYWFQERWTDDVLYAMLEEEWNTLGPLTR